MRAKISLRVSMYLWLHEQRRAELLAFLREYRDVVDEVAFFTGVTHPPLPLPVVRERAAILAELIPAFCAFGLNVGINHLATMGHLDENLANSLNEPWQHLVDLDGTISKSCYCVADPRMQDYVRESYRALAAAGPSFIWVDDDVRMESHPRAIRLACFCPRCLAAFSAQTGQQWTRESLREAFRSKDREERLALRRQWLEHNRRYIRELLALIRAAVDEVDPNIQLGLMTGEATYSGLGYEEWTEALAGPRRMEVKWRPGGGFYTDEVPLGALRKAHATGRQIGWLPASVCEVQYEHENFPYQPLKKSVTTFVAEGAAAIGAGCTGVALNCMGISPDPFEAYRPYFDGVRACRVFYDAAVAAAGRSLCRGLWLATTQDHAAVSALEADWTEASLWGSDLGTLNEMSEIGLPIAYRREGASIAVLSGDNCLEWSRDELVQLLSSAVLLDGPALARLEELDLADLAGFRVQGKQDVDTIEVLTADPLNGPFVGYHRDCRPSFYAETTYLLEPLSAHVRPLAEVVDFTPTRLGIGVGAYENRLGGRVAVLGYYPWRMMHTPAKVAQLKALCRWLARDTLPGFVASYHRVALWCRGEAANPALLVLNVGLDRAVDVQVCVRTERAVLRMTDMDGNVAALSAVKRDGPYRLFVIPHLDPWRAALLA